MSTLPPAGRAASWDSAYRNAPPPWDIGRPQSAIVQLADEGLITAPVLDSGCGTGEHALFLAARGLEVTGVDIAPSAIERARTKAMQRRIDVTFMVGDVLELPGLGRRFRTVIDSGVFHVFETDDAVARYVAGLHAVLEPDGVLHLMCFSNEEPGSWGPRRVTREELRAAFATGWQIESIERATFEVNPPMTPAHAWLARCRRAGA
jgi:2-polyprenyl-3-methyl-5-hydroxy-6-metoxy-1,4-benzoquinol methylase